MFHYHSLDLADFAYSVVITLIGKLALFPSGLVRRFSRVWEHNMTFPLLFEAAHGVRILTY